MFFNDLIKTDTRLAFSTAIIIYYIQTGYIYKTNYKKLIVDSISFACSFVIIFLLAKNILNI